MGWVGDGKGKRDDMSLLGIRCGGGFDVSF